MSSDTSVESDIDVFEPPESSLNLKDSSTECETNKVLEENNVRKLARTKNEKFLLADIQIPDSDFDSKWGSWAAVPEDIKESPLLVSSH